MPSRAVVWFRRDLRVADHPALRAALDAADQVAPVFVVDRALLDGRPSGPNRRAFLHGALRALARDLEALGGRLLVLEGDPVELLPILARELAADAVYCSREHTPYARRRDTAVEGALRADGRALHALPGVYLSDFDELRSRAGDPFRVYSPFARAAKAAAWDDPLPAPARVPVPDDLPAAGAALERFDLDGAVEIPPPDPAAALERLRWFVDRRVDGYARTRNVMAADGTSRLSPYLRFGLVSPRQVAAAVTGGNREPFVNELLWRDFYAYLLHHRPESAWEHLRPEFAWFELEDDPEGLAAWREGRTGYPLVDAGMRQLTGQGWVHNRARMVAASFLTKHLLVDWREGARFFLQHLVDGDLASNNGGWQWVAGSGIDAAPYYRIFNPVTQAERFDPGGDYLRRWVPELAKLDPPAIFAPWRADPADLEAAGVRLGTDYPYPIVDHISARNRALSRFQEASARRS
ncbi:MAG TPA: deoxyribodipyrimidine photo-lyase [Actinomycetota bacterium]|jgi:deoxyribodipyrimidine photo-lyase|nr:deoxyribodipyrimidine photo-lyase [Actinomycetota bacterium]